MSTVSEPLAPPARAPWKPKANPWTIAFVVTLATFMEILDTSIANVALPHIAGNLSVTEDEATWVLSSYLVANAIVMPLGAWLGTRFGRKRFYMFCVFLFGVSSLLCGLAPNLPMLILFRVLQGLGGGGLAPTEQAILADTFAPEKRGQAFSVYAMAVVVAPVIGPTLGGFITDNYSWRWLFLINVPVAILSLTLTSRILEDPPFLKELRDKMRSIDYGGLALLAIGIGALQVVLDKGERSDWFSSPFVVMFAAIAASALVTAIIWEYRHPFPVLDVRLFKLRNFSMACVMMFMLGVALYGATVLIPQFLQVMMGYTAQQAGMALSPGGLVIIATMPLIGRLVSKMDARWLIAFGFTSVGLALWHMHSIDLSIDFRTAMMLRVYQAIGMGFLFVPIQTMCYEGVPPEKNNNISGITNLSRNLGGSVGIAGLQILQTRRAQFHQNAMSAQMSQFNPVFQDRLTGLTQMFMQKGNDAVHSSQMAYQMLYGQLQQQAGVRGYLDVIAVFACVCLVMVPMAFLMKRMTGRAPARGGH